MMTFLTDRLPGLDSRFCLLLTLGAGSLCLARLSVGRRICGRPPSARPIVGQRPLCGRHVHFALDGRLSAGDRVAAGSGGVDARPFVSERAGNAGGVPLAQEVGIDRLSLDGRTVDRTLRRPNWRRSTIWPTTIKLFGAVLAEPAMPRCARISVYATVAYGLGLAPMLTRVCVGCRSAVACAASIPIDDPAMLDMVRGHAARLALRVLPAIASCSRVSVPVVVGMLRPMILLPASLATGLTGRQLEYVLLHELAHIHRYDMLANLLQRLIETGLFFHPAVWWLTRQVSIERENACDDAVLRAGCQRAAYAEALLRVAELCIVCRPRGFARWSAGGHRRKPEPTGSRIHRLFNVEQPAAVRARADRRHARFVWRHVIIALAPGAPQRLRKSPNRRLLRTTRVPERPSR